MKDASSQVVLLVASLLVGVPATADTLFGVYAGANSWDQKPSGDVSSGSTTANVRNDLGLSDETKPSFFVAVEHPLPSLPNLRGQYTTVGFSGANTLTSDVDFNGVVFPATTDIATHVDMKVSDAILYYQLLDNVVSLDLGLDVRFVDGHADVTSTAQTSHVKLNGAVALPYVSARLDLPLTGLSLSAQVSGLGYSGESLVDADVKLGWESFWGLGVEAGYRTFRMKLDNVSDIDKFNLAISGPYAGVNYHF